MIGTIIKIMREKQLVDPMMDYITSVNAITDKGVDKIVTISIKTHR